MPGPDDVAVASLTVRPAPPPLPPPTNARRPNAAADHAASTSGRLDRARL